MDKIKIPPSWKVLKNHMQQQTVLMKWIIRSELSNDSISIYVRNLQVLATEMYKVSDKLSTPIIKIISPVSKTPYILRDYSQLSIPALETAYHETESISDLWDLVPSSLREIDDLQHFIQVNKKRKSEDCPCWLYKVYVQNVGFL